MNVDNRRDKTDRSFSIGYDPHLPLSRGGFYS